VEAFRVVGDGQPSRVTIWSRGKLDADVFQVSDSAGDRLIIRAADMVAPPQGDRVAPDPVTGVDAYDWAPGQLTLQLGAPMMVARQLDLPPAGAEARHRLVLDLMQVSRARFDKAVERDRDRLAHQKASSLEVAEAGQADGRVPGEAGYVIVIDPGHCGRDPGAPAVGGGHEKTIVLQAAHRLRALLERDARFDVRLTRSDDSYVGLEARVSLARQWGADLFISLHADAAGSPEVRGASVYTISESGESRIDREAAKNDWSMPIEDGVSKEVSGILADLIKRETKTNSSLFAEQLLPELAAAGPVLRNTHRNAGYYVLLAPDVPAVLVEIGFLSNRADARRLRSKQGREEIVQALARAINTYFDHGDGLLAQN